MRATAILGLVRRLLAHEAAQSQDQEPLIEATERALDKLGTHLSNSIGQEGFRTLLARALSLTTILFPNLSAVRVGSDGSLVGLRKAARIGLPETHHNEAQQDTQNTGERQHAEDRRETDEQKETAEGAEALIANLFGLLFAFIGEDLTLHILSKVWPELVLDDATDREERP